MDIFDQNAFTLVEMTDGFEETEYLPQELNEDFETKSVSTEKVAIEVKKNVLTLIPTSERGSPIDEKTGQKRDIRDFRTVRLAKGSTIYASEVANVRAFGSATEAMQIENLVTERVTDLDNDLELSLEKMRLGAIQGKMIDPVSGDIIYDWFDEFGVTQPAIVDFDLDNANPAQGALMKKCTAMARAIIKESKGAVTPQTKIKAKVGSKFWDDLVSHPEVEKTYLNWQAAQDLRGDLQTPFGSFKFGGIYWSEYRGTDDDTKVAIGATEANFYPVGVKGNLVHTMSPSDEHMEFVNTPGKRKYALMEQDPATNKKWARAEIYSYPLFYVSRPLTLRRGKA